MNAAAGIAPPLVKPDSGIIALCGIAAFYRISADPEQLKREIDLIGRNAAQNDVMRAGQHLGLKARIVASLKAERLCKLR